MAEGFRCCGGGIFGLLELIEEYPEQVEYDLIAHGLRLRQLGTEQLSWRDLLVIIRQQPRDSALVRSMDPDTAHWGMSEHLLAIVADAARLGVWQRGGGKKSDRPKPIPRPGSDEGHKKVHKGDVLPMDQMAAWLGGDFEGLVPA